MYRQLAYPTVDMIVIVNRIVDSKLKMVTIRLGVAGLFYKQLCCFVTKSSPPTRIFEKPHTQKIKKETEKLTECCLS